MAGLGIYRNYKRIKNEQQLMNPAVPSSNKVQAEATKFTPEDAKRYQELRNVIKSKQSQLSQDKTK